MKQENFKYRIINIHSFIDYNFAGEKKIIHEFERIADNLDSLDSCIVFLRNYMKNLCKEKPYIFNQNFRIIRKQKRHGKVFNVNFVRNTLTPSTSITFIFS